ncbi:MAG: alpha/beta hydrolase [Leptolyngbyaceae bacterium]|nr:alpha/beta hydrolase [Leptolyngbyaceae bacterium]
MQHHEGTFQGAGKLNLYYQSWHPSDPCKAIALLVHGLGAHSQSFQNMAEYLTAKGYGIYSFDLRGNGRSPGQRGHIQSWAEFREDLNAFLPMIKAQAPGIPCFLIGHSLGGVIVLDYVLRTQAQVQGVVAIAPALGVTVPPWKLLLGRIFSKILPRFSLSTGIDLSFSAHDPAVLDTYVHDPLRHSRGSARMASEFLETVVWIQTHATDWQVPLLMLCGGADRVTPSVASCTFFQQIAFLDKEWREYPEEYHELHNDSNAQTVFADLEDWLERHLTSS